MPGRGAIFYFELELQEVLIGTNEHILHTEGIECKIAIREAEIARSLYMGLYNSSGQVVGSISLVF